jgi:hypothetical protein
VDTRSQVPLSLVKGAPSGRAATKACKTRCQFAVGHVQDGLCISDRRSLLPRAVTVQRGLVGQAQRATLLAEIDVRTEDAVHVEVRSMLMFKPR